MIARSYSVNTSSSVALLPRHRVENRANVPGDICLRKASSRLEEYRFGGGNENAVRADHTGQTEGSLGHYYCDIANATSDILSRLSLRGFNKSRRTESPLCDWCPLYFVHVVLIYSTRGFPYLPFTDGDTEER
jgi:hypothetical protein